jgi:hypothetical protein
MSGTVKQREIIERMNFLQMAILREQNCHWLRWRTLVLNVGVSQVGAIFNGIRVIHANL